ncbi:MAG TPA: hypothetical protein PKD20_01755 [Candidatus Saccharibacteria bacterium]|jgi:hypothetical protein|nr:hypothetical protein [Candidatus Saccharibacteria bacterium]HMT55583.1 hypothetical protein [Candidatus Saccharibacteria bacterium]
MAKKATIKKITKSNKKNLSLKKLDFKKNWKKLSYIGLSAFLAVVSVGYAGWDRFGQKDASAANSVNTLWITSGSYINLYTCKSNDSSGKYKISTFLYNRSIYQASSTWVASVQGPTVTASPNNKGVVKSGLVPKSTGDLIATITAKGSGSASYRIYVPTLPACTIYGIY